MSKISPVLFMTLEGEPMRFFLRPGATKQRLQAQIKAGGGLVTRAQDQAGAILLADPEEVEALPNNVSHWYVSTQYILDCLEKNQQLEVEDYRLKPESPGRSTRLKARSSGPSLGGRLPYTPEEDAAILSYIAKHKDSSKSIGGNQLWQEMGKNNVTAHTWQSMKARYKKCLAHRHVGPEQERPDELETESDLQASSSERSQSDSEDMEVTNAVQLNLSLDESPPPNTSPSPEPEKQQAASCSSPVATQHLPRSPQVVLTRMAVSSIPLSSLERARLDRAKEATPPPSKKPKSTDRKIPPPKDTSTPQKQKHASPLPQQQKDTSTEQDAVENGTSTTDQPRGESGATVSDNGIASASERQAGGKRKRKLGILEMASKEFESSDDGDDQTGEEEEDASVMEKVRDCPNPPAAAPGPSTTTTTLQEKNGQPPPEEEAAPAACPRAVALPSDPPPTTTTTASSTTNSKAHLFIFDGESQDGRSQPVDNNNVGTGTSSSCPAPPPPRQKEAVESLTQTQLGEDIQRMKALMKQTDKDLQSVTKALLRASGDFAVARSLLLTPSSVPGPVWSRSDDNLLRAGDPVVRERLQDKYGAEAVAKRLLFLEELRALTKALLQASEDLAVAWSLFLAPSSVPGPFWSRWTCLDDSFLRSGDFVVRERLRDKFGEEAVAKRILTLEVE